MDAKDLVKYINKALMNLNRTRLVRTISSVVTPVSNKTKKNKPKRSAST